MSKAHLKKRKLIVKAMTLCDKDIVYAGDLRSKYISEGRFGLAQVEKERIAELYSRKDGLAKSYYETFEPALSRLLIWEKF